MKAIHITQLEGHAMRLKNRLQNFCSTRAYRRSLYTINRTAKKPEISDQDRASIRKLACNELVSQSPEYQSDSKAFIISCAIKADHIRRKISELTSSIDAHAPSIEPGLSSLLIVSKLIGAWCLTACLVIGESILARLLVKKSEIFENFAETPLLSQISMSSTLVLMALVFHCLYSCVCDRWKNTFFYFSLVALSLTVLTAIISFGFTYAPTEPIDYMSMAGADAIDSTDTTEEGGHNTGAIISGISLMLSAIFAAPLLARYVAKQQASLKAMYPHKETVRMRGELVIQEEILEDVLTAKSIAEQSLESFEAQCERLEDRVESRLLTEHAENN